MGKPRSLLILLLIVLGLGQGLAWAFGFNNLRMLFRATGASPLPLVFAVHQGHEYWSPRYELHVTTRSGRKESIPLGSAHFRAIEGPYKLKLMTVGSVLFSELQSNRQLRWDLGRRFCSKDGDLNRIFGIHEDLERLAIETIGRSKPYHSSRAVECE